MQRAPRKACKPEGLQDVAQCSARLTTDSWPGYPNLQISGLGQRRMSAWGRCCRKRLALSARSHSVRLCRRHLPALGRAVRERPMERSRYLSQHAGSRGGIERLLRGIGVHDPAELLPFRAVPALQTHLRPVLIDGSARVDGNARSRHRNFEVVQTFGLLDDIFARQVVATLLEYLFKHHALTIPEQIAGFADIRSRKILCEEGAISFHSVIIVPGRVSRILVKCSDDHACGLVETCRLERRNRTGREIDNESGLPTDLSYLSNSLGGELWRSRNKKRAASRTPDAYDLRVGGGVGDFISGGYHLLFEIAFEERPEGVDIVFAEIVVLVEDSVLGVRQCGGQVFCVDFAFGIEAERRRSERKFLDVDELLRAGHDGNAGNPPRREILCCCRNSGRTELTKQECDLVALDQPANILNGLRRAIGIVQRDVIDLPPIHAALSIDRLHVHQHALSNDTEAGSWTAEGKNASDLYSCRGDAGGIRSISR